MIPFNLKFIFVMLMIMIILLVISSIELYINKRKAIWCASPSQGGIVIMPDSSKKAKTTDPIYIYNSKKIKREDLDYQIGYDENLYTKKRINEHIASKINTPIKSIISSVMLLPSSSTPINDIFEAIGKSSDVVTSVDPSSTKETKYKMLTSIRDDVEAFMAGGKIYIVK